MTRQTIGFSAEIPVSARPDVLVVGGGLGGVAAALASARAGAETMLIERNGFLGGVATAGLCCGVFVCLFTLDGKSAVGGIPLEIVQTLSEKAGPGDAWRKHKGHVIYDLEKAKVVLEGMLKDAGVTILYETAAQAVLTEGRRITGVVVGGHNGLNVIEAKQVIDASGEADVAKMAGAALAERKPVNIISYLFRFGNVDVDRFANVFREHPEEYPEHVDVDWTVGEALAQYDECGTFLYPHFGTGIASVFMRPWEEAKYPKEIGLFKRLHIMQLHCIKSLGVAHVICGFCEIPNLNADALSEALIDGRKVAQSMEGFYRDYIPGFENAYVSATADDLGIRISRNIIGRLRLTDADLEAGRRFPDSIGQGVTLRKIPVVKESILGQVQTSGQAMSNMTYDIPLSCMTPAGFDNLLMGAGRSCDTMRPTLLRVMVSTMTVGQGAGVAAAIAAKSGCTTADISLESLEHALRRQGVVLA